MMVNKNKKGLLFDAKSFEVGPDSIIAKPKKGQTIFEYAAEGNIF